MVSVTAWVNSTGHPAPGSGYNLRNRKHGIENPDGARWGKTSVKKFALRPTNAGLRVHHKGRPDERVAPSLALWVKAEGYPRLTYWGDPTKAERDPEHLDEEAQ